MKLEHFNPELFLKDFWQKKPCVVRNALGGVERLLSPDELAGLACEDTFDSRLVQESPAAKTWSVKYGPFSPSEFATLPESHWSLLVQDLDKYLPELFTFRQLFRFIPDWRIDDVMASFAPDGGSVGAHIDNYDVFLVQARGQRLWQIESHPTIEDSFVAGLDLRILQEFHPDQSWLLEPGDMLYLPPRFAHHGIAQDECMTLSVGFRAPSYQALYHSYHGLEYEESFDDSFYSDPDLTTQEHPAQIARTALGKIAKYLKVDSHNHEYQVWLGRFLTENELSPEIPVQLDISEFLTCLESKGLVRNESSQFAFIENPDKGMLLFVDGEHYECSNNDACGIYLLTDNTRYPFTTKFQQIMESSSMRSLWLNLYNLGHIYFRD